MGIDCAVGAIPLFWVDVPLSSQQVRLCTQASGPETDDHVEGREKFRPVHLSMIEHLCHQEVFEVLVIGSDSEFSWQSFKVVIPIFKSLYDCKELLVINLVVLFEHAYCLRSVYYKVPKTVVSLLLREDFFDGKVEGVNLDLGK